MFVVVIGAEGLRYSVLDGGLIPLQGQEDASFLNQDMIITTTNQDFGATCPSFATVATCQPH
jgi:hypothetical protein